MVKINKLLMNIHPFRPITHSSLFMNDVFDCIQQFCIVLKRR